MTDSDFRPLTIHKASAGSGKTFSLAREYITLLLGVPRNADDPSQGLILNHPAMLGAERRPERNRHSHILAITFTNKATEEMKTRIIDELECLARRWNDPDKDRRSKYTDHLVKTLGATPQLIAETAEQAMNQILNDYTHFSVSTIDSFFQLVLRNMAYELDCPGDYEVTLDEKAVIGEGVGLMLDNINMPSHGADPLEQPLGRKLRNYMLMRRRAGKFNIFNRDVSLFRTIITFAESLFKENYRFVAEDFEQWMDDESNLSHFIEAIEAMQKKLAAGQQGLAAEVMRTISSGEYGPSEDDLNGRSAAANFLKKHSRGTETTDTVIDKLLPFLSLPEERYLENAAEAFPYTGIFKKSAAVNYALHRRILLTLRDILLVEGELRALRAVAKSLDTYAIINEISRFVKNYVTSNNLVVLSDTSQLLYRMLGTDSDQVPFMYEKLGVRLQHFLIDEFQDTSRMQWDTLEPLVSESLANDSGSLIIGDEKQAIYRFRNSDSELLHSVVPDQYAGRARIAGASVSENTNYRSSHAVVRFNNTVFRRMAVELGETSYSNVVQGTASKTAGLKGRVEVIRLDARVERAADECGEDETPPDVNTMRERLLVENIRTQHANGYPYGKIAVLTYTNKQCAQVVRLLVGSGIPVVTDEAMFLNRSDAVNLVAGVLMRIASPRLPKKDGEASGKQYGLRRHIDAPTFVNRFEAERNQLVMSGVPTADAQRQAMRSALGAVADDDVTLLSQLNVSSTASLTTLVEAVIEHFITPDRRLAEAPYLAAFHDAVADYVRTSGQSLVGFVRWWRTHRDKLSVSAASGADAVRVMTIHKSKGLEFACVHLPFMGADLKGSRNDVAWIRTPGPWKVLGFPPALRVEFSKGTGMPGSPLREYYEKNMHDRLLDGLNKVYVAFTRAVNELSVYLEDAPDGQGHSLCGLLDRALRQPAEEQPAEIDMPVFEDTAALVNDEGEYQSGEPTVYEPESGKETDTVVKPLDVRLYRMSLNAGKALTVSRSVLDEEPEITDDSTAPEPFENEATRRGTRIHRIMERIHTLRDVEPALRWAARRLPCTMDDVEVVERFFNAPELLPLLQRWFVEHDAERNEVTIYDPDAEHTPRKDLRTQRIDRLVFLPNGEIHVLDYKTSAEDPDPAIHRPQILGYMKRVSALYPERRVRGFLLFVDACEITEVKPRGREGC